MKSTTLRRSGITKEKVAMMEALNSYNRRHHKEDFYQKQSKNKELDVLWQSFGIKQQKNEKSPQVYFVIGMLCGAFATLAIVLLVSLLVSFSTSREDVIAPQPKKIKTETSSKFTFIPADNSSSKSAPVVVANEKYVVKEGDTLESIVIRFYGSFDMDKVNAIQSANKMANPNALSIGQKLIIPMNN